ncbi:capsule biosynthesis protein [Tabrizicola sp.]|uniref:capsule biosynthesis protein n=1 Tax=Tabrizicola sp. TaxID=2005166 RepID=UPI00261AED85|nr:capsule biosynthesis protein [Tabrizicola sp.]MDM7930628.1 capsule biosynthesis protein [Tabrizicola sp.]
MTTRPKAARFFVRKVERPAQPPAAGADDLLFDNHDDGFGNQDFRPGAPAADPGAAAMPAPGAPRSQRPGGEEPDDAALAAIAAEGLTSRQLRRARLLAQKHDLGAGSDLDAVLKLRRAGINPFARASLLEVVTAARPGPQPDPAPDTDAASTGQGRALARLPGDQVQLPQRPRPISLPSTEKRAEVSQAAEILRMQQDIARRRRRKLVLLFARLAVFVLLPTFLAGWYFYRIATPIYATKSEFVIQQAGPAASGGSLGGLFSGTALATSQDSIAVQGYLQSREAMSRLETDLGFRAHFRDGAIDSLQRLDPTATMEKAYSMYKRFVKIAYDPSEGLVRMEVMAADPRIAAAWANQLINYAEEQVDQLTQRLRADQMRDAQQGYDEAQTNLAASQRRLIELQEKFKILSSETEVGLITAQISSLETQLTQDRLSLAQMEANETPNVARMDPLKRRIAALESEIGSLRSRMTESGTGETSLAQVQGELLVAQADLQTRQLILAQSLQSMETARVEANRQVRYLSVSVHPTAPDEAAYPRAFENTMVTMLILLGIYLMVSMTAAILREQVSA